LDTIRRSETRTADAVKALELQRFGAMVRGDFDALAALLADDLIYHHSNAHADTKASWLASLRSGQTTFLSMEPELVSVNAYGPSTAIVSGTMTVTVIAGGERQVNPLRFLDVWVERGGQWQMVAWQSTRRPD
jgi:ketosteroid isomerase-like protein